MKPFLKYLCFEILPCKIKPKLNLTEDRLHTENYRHIKPLALTLFFIIALASSLWAQNLNIDGTVSEGRAKLSGVDVILKKGSTVVSQMTTGGNGTFQMTMALDDEYTIYFQKDGFATKKIDINTKDVPDSERKYGDFNFPRWTVELYSKSHNVNYALLNKPVGVVLFLPYNGNFGIDPDYASEMKPQLEQLENQVAAAIEEKEQEKEQINIDYKQAIKDGENFLKSKEYDNALDQFYAAADLKPDQDYPKKQIEKVKQLVDAQKDIDEQYGNYLTMADDALADQKWDEAKTNYQQASSLKPKEAYPKEQLAKVDQLKKEAEAAQLKEAYEKLIADADAAFDAGKLAEAKPLYQDASAKMPKEAYPKGKVKEIDGLLAAQAKKDGDYNKAIAAADGMLSAEKWAEAKVEYEKASGIKPDETYPKDKIKEIEKLIADKKAAEEAAKAQLKAEYDKLISDADAAFGKEEFESAKGLYQQASEKMPDESYPKGKIKECDSKLGEQQKLNAEYDKIIASADGLVGSDKLQEAIAEYKKASGVKPNEDYPKTKIAELEKTIADRKAAEEEAAAKLKAMYDQMISDADAAFGNAEYETAKGIYQQASEKMPDEAYPKGKIKECDAKLGEEQKLNAEYDKIIASADGLAGSDKLDEAIAEYKKASGVKPAEEYPKTKIAELEKTIADRKAAAEEEAAKLKAMYDQMISDADAAFGNGEYETAKGIYQQASEKMPDESYPKDKVKECDAKLGELAKVDAEYQKAIDQAEKLFASEKLEEAKTAFEGALAIKDDEYPKGKIKEIDGIIAERKAADEAAKKAAEEAAAKLKAEYDQMISDADAAFNNGEYETAKGIYQQASTKMPDESYPKDKIKECDSQLGALAKQEDAYNKAIEKADQLFGEEKLAEAKAGYEEALGIKEDAYPKGKIAEIEKKIADNKAAEEAAKKAAEEAAAKLKAEYDQMISDADAAFNNGEYETAKGIYQQASAKMPDESYPKDKIKECDSQLGALAKKEEAYQKEIEKADKYLSEQKYGEAKTGYESALAIKDDAYPKEKIKEIEDKLASDAAAAEAAKKAEEEAKAKLKAEYDKLIADADAAFGGNDYSGAKGLYEQAALKMPDESYPKDKIKECENHLGALAKKDEAYQKEIEKADKYLSEQKYGDAKAGYEAALAIKDESYPKDKIKEIEEKLASDAAAAEAAKKAEEEAKAKLKVEYDQMISDADAAFNNGEYETAKGIYEQASLKMPNESYPKDKIKECESQLGALAKTDEEYQKTIEKADKLFAEASYDNAKSAYEKALSIKDDAYPKQKIEEIAAKKEELLAQEAANKEAAAAAEKDEAYNNALSKANDLLASGKLDEAKVAFEAAKAIKDDGSLAAKFEEIEQKRTELAAADKAAKEAEASAAKDKEYQDLVAKGDKFFSSNKYTEAKASYESALAIKDDAYPKQKIQEIEAALASLADQEAAQKKEEEYKNAVANADKLFRQKNYEDARIAYSDALEINPNEQYPKDKIEEIEAIFEGEELEKKGKEEKLRAEYEALIAEADDLFNTQDYNAAKKKYKEAGKVLSDETYSGERINEIDALLENLASAEENYKNSIKEGDSFLKDDELSSAKSSFETALSIKPDEEYPKSKLAEIEQKLLAQKEADELKKAEEAKLLAEQQAEEERKRKEEEERLAQQKAEEEAKQAELAAVEAKKREEEEKKKAEEAKLLAEQQAEEERLRKAEEARLAEEKAAAAAKQAELAAAENRKKEAAQRKQAEVRGKYDAAIASADDAFGAQQYERAKKLYNDAQAILPSESYPADQIEEIDNLMSKQKRNVQEYESLIARGDKLILLKDYDNALNKFEKAKSLKPSESYPAERISFIKEKMSNLSSSEVDRLARLKEKNVKINEAYDEYVQKADNALAKEYYGEAKNMYFKALEVKPRETYPRQQIEEVKRLAKIKVAKIQKEKEEAEAKKRKENEYKKLVAEADHFYKTGNYETAIKAFEEASNSEFADSYPQKRIGEIEREVEEIETEKAEALAKKEEEKSRRIEFVKHVKQGNGYLGQKDYENAISSFELALEIYPEDNNVATKLREAKKGLDDRIAAEEAKRQAEEEKRQKLSDYKKVVSEADQLYLRRKYKEALPKYKEAVRIMPGQSHPKVRINKINLKLAEQARREKMLAKKAPPKKVSLLASKYPQGVTEKVTEEGNKKTTQIIIIDGEQGDEYNMIEYSFGKTYYLKNGKPYNERSWKNETGK